MDRKDIEHGLLIQEFDRKMNQLLSLISILFLTGLTACVGTVQEATAPQNLEYKNPPTTFVFPGITTARAIAHNKVELEFYPRPEKSTRYYLYINDAASPVSIDLSSLLLLPGGNYLYTVTGLLPDREYKFKLTADEPTTGKKSSKENEVFARTFDNIVSDFTGVSKLTLVPGKTDSVIRVDWTIPPMTGIFMPNATDTVNYEITYISEVGGAVNLNNSSYSGSDRRQYFIHPETYYASPKDNPNHVLLENLAPNTTYYVRVRAVQMVYMDYYNNPDIRPIPVNREMNSRVMSIKTEPSSSLFDFNTNSVLLLNAPGDLAFENIDVFWQPGSGTFTEYRIFIRKYDGSGSAQADDQLTESALMAMTAAKNYTTVSASSTSRRFDGLETGATYQVKVVLCKVTNCPVSAADPNAAIISELKTIVVKPTLAPFSGINAIDSPSEYSERDMVKLRFDSPLLDYGYANRMEFYCVDPADYSRMVLFNGENPISSSSIGHCDGLYLSGLNFDLKTYTKQDVKGIIADGAHQYCFASTPAIIGRGDEVRMPKEEMIVRCSYPEILPPTVTEFPGIEGGCMVNATNGKISWKEPTGGIYSHYQVFWKEKVGSIKFSFVDAISGAPGYFSGPDLPASTTDFTATNLMPGRTYQIGVLAKVDMDAPIKDLYSEYNLKVQDCVVPLPVASFKGFTRIFAIGPKTDGRFPNEWDGKTSPDAAIYEAIDSDGLPYEVAMTAPATPDPSSEFLSPPGRDYGASFNEPFDGASSGSLAMSKSGIISLAWEEVEMSFPEADHMFNDNQPNSPASRTGRNWGYRVYRSSDNKLTWQELTSANGLIYSMDYNYRHRPNSSPVPRRMAFFTDYSVKALDQYHEQNSGKDIERARTYFYRIVPVFDGKNLNYSSQHHIVKVTLPPPNMALVHRWMANRAHCLEFDKTPEISNNYGCSYNGVGSKPKSIPYRVGDTMLDQGGDLLIDRFELGCRFTRGVATATPESAESNFNPPESLMGPNDKTIFALFKGYRTSPSGSETTTPFVGCTGKDSRTLGATGTGDDYPPGFTPTYVNALQGDCIGHHNEVIARNNCSAAAYAQGEFNTISVVAPGASQMGEVPADCSDTSPDSVNTYPRKYMGDGPANFLIQSEFLAVFYNTYSPNITSGGQPVAFEGPSPSDLNERRNLSINHNVGRTNTSSQCNINLAAIDGSGFMKPRWVSVNDLSGGLKFKEEAEDLMGKTVEQITEVVADTEGPLTFYNGEGNSGGIFRKPPESLWNSSRFKKSTRMAKIFSSNSAKLPPLGRVSLKVAQSICQNYFVQTGAASDNGNFAPDALPVAKRPIRRPESITASAWPDHFDDTTIENLEGSTDGGSCNSRQKNVYGQMLTKGNLLTNRITHYSSSAAGVPLLTGSSKYNGVSTNMETNHTGRCMSRYGVQDLIGNMAEVNSEHVFCDYSQDRSYFGDVAGNWTPTSIVNRGAEGVQFPFWNSNVERDDWGILKSFELRFQDNPGLVKTDLKPWVEISTDSGYCSLVDDIPTRRTGLADYFKEVSSGFWNPIYVAGGSLNSEMITEPQPDQNAVRRWRNGDGRFLDFGPQGLASALNTADSLSLRSTKATGKYFNPLIGLPLRCAGGSCHDPMLEDHSDNTYITTSFLRSKIDPDPNIDDQPAINDFFVGRSDISHLGLSEFTTPPLTYQTFVVPANGFVDPPVNRMLASVTLQSETDHTVVSQEVKMLPDDFPPGPVEFYRVVWDVPRGSSFGVRSGGKSHSNTTGRYAASLDVSNNYYNGSSDMANGTRCAVMINEDP